MIDIQSFTNQHDALLERINTLQSMLTRSKEEWKIDSLHSNLLTFFGELNVHLAMEDKSLYPNLLNHKNKTVRNLAKEFLMEMGNLANEVKVYRNHWISQSRILASPQKFFDDSQALFRALIYRIKRENQELYPLIGQSES